MQRDLAWRQFLLILLLMLLPIGLSAQRPDDLVNIKDLDSTIIVDLKYATADNFLHDTLYAANICLLRRAVAERLVKVHRTLQAEGLGLKIWDGYRPLSVQKKMWQKVPDPRYVADPARGSNHNRGAAVDVTLVDRYGNELEMPTKFDDFSPAAASDYPYGSATARKNRERLKQAMRSQGFRATSSEWWHFNAHDCKKYSILDVPLEQFARSHRQN
ncbi:MAG: M15 family metallopeptidase [candidate division KSB1 bacterium]|nr:M15 family metallopeptidase [candidate division KSB1 bacterium]MDZ7334005.1 M15 family metallopeptidase [candidate division KSB1 bacterium]MDZ7357440.1 M15 family metallopeptidase [candidate division KSB1 bacterium]MDZ7375909.1 M15 family metallopeptidase [candidate division KSB1 bacterium]MDZ7399990.1 M15 family metallopeptidase [candidate division KSB1 bacterium]